MLNFKEKNNYLRKDAHLKFHNVARASQVRHLLKTRSLDFRDKDYLNDSLPTSFLANQILKSLPENDLNRLYEQLEMVSFNGGDNIYEPLEPVRYVYFPENIVVSQFHVLEDGNTTEFAMIGKEGMLGSCALLNSQPSNHWTQAVIGGNAYRIKIENLLEEFTKSGLLQQEIYKFTNAYINQIALRVACSVHHLTEARFCNWLLMIQDRFGSERLPLTQDQIARFLGVHRPCITHIAQQLRDDGIINYVRGNITIINKPELEKLACECYQKIEN